MTTVYVIDACVSQTGWTPLHLACHRGHIELVDALIRHGAKLDCRSRAGLIPRDLARAARHTQVVTVVEAAMNAHAAEEQTNEENQLPAKEQQLWQLVEAKDAMAVETLLRSGGVDADAPQPEVCVDHAPCSKLFASAIGFLLPSSFSARKTSHPPCPLGFACDCATSHPSSPPLLSIRLPLASPANGATRRRPQPSLPPAPRSIAPMPSAGRR